MQLFYTSLFSSFVKQDAQAIAVITASSRTVRRKFDNRTIWERVKKGAPIYAGDTIRTAARAQTTLAFENGMQSFLPGNTMAQVLVDETGAFSISVQTGMVYFSDNTVVTEGKTAYVETATEAKKRLSLEPQFPPDGYQVWKAVVNTVPFTLAGENLPRELLVSIARDRAGGDIVYQAPFLDTSHIPFLADGTYWWSVKNPLDEAQQSEVQSFTVVSAFSAPEMVSPRLHEAVTLLPDEALTFTWKAVPSAAYYRFRLFKKDREDADNALLLEDESFLTRPYYTYASEQLESGSYLWEVSAFSEKDALSSRRGGETAFGAFTLSVKEPEKVNLEPIPASFSYAGAVDASTFQKIRLGITAIAKSNIAVTVDLSKSRGLLVIPSGAFINCDKLFCVILPATVRKIEARAFDGCAQFAEIKYAGSKEAWEKIIVQDVQVQGAAIEYEYQQQ